MFYSLLGLDMALALQLKVLQAALEFIRSTANHDSESPLDAVQSPSAYHHSVPQKRRSIAGEYQNGTFIIIN